MSGGPRIVVLGLGNDLRRDDGVGVVAARLLQADGVDGAEVHDVGAAVLHGLELVDGADAVLLLDAIHGGAPPGALHRCDLHALPPDRRLRALHGWSLLDMLSLHRIPLPAVATAAGVEPADLDAGGTLSPPVAAALPRLLDLARVWAHRQRIALEVAPR